MMRLCDFILFLVSTILLFTCLQFRQEIDLNKKNIKILQEEIIQFQEKASIAYDATSIPKEYLGQVSYTKLAGEE